MEPAPVALPAEAEPLDAIAPRSIAERYCLWWHEAMSPAVEVEYVQGIRNLQAISPIPRWSLYAGSGAAKIYLDALVWVWDKKYDIKVT